MREWNKKNRALFGLIGVLFLLVMLFVASLLTLNYSFFECTVSSLGNGNGSFFFSIGFIVAGSFGIPFVISLNREFIGLSKNLRKIASILAIFSNVCIALVGVIPDENYVEVFIIFHGFVASISFCGTSICILLYSILMYQKSNKLKKHLLYYSFFITFILILLIITMNPFIEWILLILIIIWIMIISIQFYLQSLLLL